MAYEEITALLGGWPGSELIEVARETVTPGRPCRVERGRGRVLPDDPQAGQQWRPAATPTRYPHEHIRDGTAKLLALFLRAWARCGSTA